jgi:hypothetical protein
MDISGKTLWQVAAGDADRNYADLCLKWDVILNGPGSEGAWPDCVPKLVDDWGLSSQKIADLRRFCESIQDGDIIILRIGTSEVFGVGVVVGEYGWRDEFCDVDGWDLQHVRRVRWLWKYDKTPERFKTNTLKRGTTQKLEAPSIEQWLAELEIGNKSMNRPIRKLPVYPDYPSLGLVDTDSISEYLFDHGVGSTSIQKLVYEIDELERIAKWYRKAASPSESETVAYLVVPLLRSLGWTPQKMAIEWHKVDLALFNKLPRVEGNLSVVVEAKRKDMSCLTAKSQAQFYAEQKGGESCKRLIVTDGLRYGIYLRKKGIFSSTPQAYLNLTDMRASYPILECDGTKEALLMMSADWMPENI